MQRDMDLVRDILLKLEGMSKPSFSDLLTEEEASEQRQKVAYHLTMLIDEVGLVTGINAISNDGPNWLDLRLTWYGHEFLDTIRDPEIWEKTKLGAAKVRGFSLDILAAIARGLIKQNIEKYTGVEVDL